jgi:hypothetical protein
MSAARRMNDHHGQDVTLAETRRCMGHSVLPDPADVAALLEWARGYLAGRGATPRWLKAAMREGKP